MNALAVSCARAHFGCCVVQGKSSVVAMEKLIRVENIYFPILDMTSDEFINFRRVVDSGSKHDDILSMMHAFNIWRRGSIVRGCLDMIAIGKMDDLHLM